MAALGSALLSSLGLTQAERAFRPWWDAIEDHIVYTIIILVRTNLIFSICCCCSPDISTIIILMMVHLPDLFCGVLYYHNLG